MGRDDLHLDLHRPTRYSSKRQRPQGPSKPEHPCRSAKRGFARHISGWTLMFPLSLRGTGRPGCTFPRPPRRLRRPAARRRRRARSNRSPDPIAGPRDSHGWPPNDLPRLAHDGDRGAPWVHIRFQDAPRHRDFLFASRTCTLVLWEKNSGPAGGLVGAARAVKALRSTVPSNSPDRSGLGPCIIRDLARLLRRSLGFSRRTRLFHARRRSPRPRHRGGSTGPAGDDAHAVERRARLFFDARVRQAS